MKKIITVGIILLGLIVEIPIAQAQGAPPANVNVVSVKQTMLTPTAWVSGQVVSTNNSSIAAEVNGRITYLAELGSRVKSGDVIARIDDSRFQLRFNEAQANVESQRARYKYLDSEVKRISALAQRNLSSKTDLDRVQSERDMARSELSESESRLAQIQQDIDYSILRAPFDGLVTQRLSNLGEYVQNGTAIIQLVETNNIEASIYAPITSYPYVRENIRLAIESPLGIEDAPIKTIIPVAEDRTHLMQIRLDLNALQWPVGLKVKVAVPNEPAKQVLAVPRDALVLRRGGVRIFRVSDENIAQQVDVRVGIGSGELVEVIGDIALGDRVIVRGAERLQDGQAVAVKPSNEHLISGKQ